jgi:signal peptidase I
MEGRTAAIVAKCDLTVEVLRESGVLRFGASGSSMLPAIRTGDVLVVHRREIQDVKPGEVAFFSCYDGVAAHRVVSKSEEHLITQGDANPSPDPSVTAENLLGVVVSIERGGKLFAPALRPRLLTRAMAAVLRRSDLATRVWLRFYRLFSSSFLKIVAPSLTASR